MAKHFDVTITDDSLAIERKQDQIEEEARLDGIYVIRTPLPAGELSPADADAAYKNLKYVETCKPHCCHRRGVSALSSVPSRSVLMLAA
jgi:hypothetical protein